MLLKGKEIVLGICGGIAAYKAAELAREMVKAGSQVHVIMTRSAREFITPLTMQTLSGNVVATDLFDRGSQLRSRPHRVGAIPAAARAVAVRRPGRGPIQSQTHPHRLHDRQGGHCRRTCAGGELGARHSDPRRLHRSDSRREHQRIHAARRQRAMPMLTPREDLPQAIACNSLAFNSGIIIGPALGGLSYGLGASVPYATAFTLLAIAAALLISLRAPSQEEVKDARTLGLIAEGLRFVWSNKIVVGAISLENGVAREDIDNRVRELFFQLTNIEEIDPEIELTSQGLDSMSGAKLLSQLEDYLKIEIGPEILFEYPLRDQFVDQVYALAAGANGISMNAITKAEAYETIKTTHVGSLPRPQELIAKALRKQETARDDLKPYLKIIMEKQLLLGITYINNGEMPRPDYVRSTVSRIAGFGDTGTAPIPQDLEEVPELQGGNASQAGVGPGRRCSAPGNR